MEPQVRAVVNEIKRNVCKQAKEMSRINDVIPVKGKRYSLPLEGRNIDIVYYKAKRENAPLILGFHGGGFLFGGCALDDGMWDAMRNQLDVNIASIGYRKSPDYMYPAAIEDAYDSAVYLKVHSKEFGFNSEHISTFGNSAGANIATCVCILAKERGGIKFKNQIMNYPFLDTHTDPLVKGEGTIEAPIMYLFNELYCKPEETKLLTVSPVFADTNQLEGLPKAIVITAENDNLRAEGERYVKLLCDAHVEVKNTVAAGMPHGYYEYGFVLSDENVFIPDEIIELISSGDIPKAAQQTLNFIDKEYVR